MDKKVTQKRAQEKYQELAKQHQPKPPLSKNLFRAFLVGGLISVAGQGVFNLYRAMGVPKPDSGGPTAVTMIFLGALLTALGVYDKIGQFGGAGSAIPITGFANTIVSAAMEFKSEGFILGMAARMFQIAGPVIVYGVVSAIMLGVIRWLLVGG